MKPEFAILYTDDLVNWYFDTFRSTIEAANNRAEEKVKGSRAKAARVCKVASQVNVDTRWVNFPCL